MITEFPTRDRWRGSVVSDVGNSGPDRLLDSERDIIQLGWKGLELAHCLRCVKVGPSDIGGVMGEGF